MKKNLHYAHTPVVDGKSADVGCGVFAKGIPAVRNPSEVTCQRCIRWMNVFGKIEGAPPYTGKEPGRRLSQLTIRGPLST